MFIELGPIACLGTQIMCSVSAFLCFRETALTCFSPVCLRGTGYIFPALVTALVPFRSFVISRYFSEDDLKYLDPYAETEDEYLEERKAYLERRPSVDSVDIGLPGFSDFHAEGIAKEMESRAQGYDPAKEQDMPHWAAEEGSSTLVRREVGEREDGN